SGVRTRPAESPLGRAGHSRTRRQAEAQFIPFRYYGSDNDPAKAGYPRSPEAASSPVDTLLKYRYGGVPVSPQKARLRGELSHMNPNEGRVEVEYRGTWGLACGDYFGREEANVYCRNLGFKKGRQQAVRSVILWHHGQLQRWDILIGHVKCAAYRGQSNLFPVQPQPHAGLQSQQHRRSRAANSAGPPTTASVTGSSPGPMTAEDAAKACKAKGAKLVAVNSQGENSFITNMLYTNFKTPLMRAANEWQHCRAWTGGQYARFRDQLEYDAWTFKDTIHLVKSDSKLWFPGFTESDARPIGNKEKQSCIAISKNFLQVNANDGTLTPTTSGGTNISCKTELPYICQKLGTLTSDCYSQSGGNYRGEAARTDKGTPCQPWSENRLVNSMTHPGQGLGEHNLLPEPRRRHQPWCWVDNERNLRLCGEGEGGDGLPTDLKPSYNHSRCGQPRPVLLPQHDQLQAHVCDSHKDCVGGEDEERELCIAISKVCDKQYDCDMGDDETRRPAGCTSAEEESDAEVQKDYTKTEKCKTRCDTMDRFVCAAFIYNHNATFGIRCTLLAQKIADATSGQTMQSGSPSIMRRS
uniref:SRCR domain-containing protein n=1 Tax=Macrostomum lignano TaxID=282301 RepID=A0A1I8F532_9PLAT